MEKTTGVDGSDEPIGSAAIVSTPPGRSGADESGTGEPYSGERAMNRRNVLRYGGALATVGLAGCVGDQRSEPGVPIDDSDDDSDNDSEERADDARDDTTGADGEGEPGTEDPDGRTCELGGRISEDTVLGNGCREYLVTRTVSVDSGATLTVEPGVTVTFASGTGIRVRRDGTLSAVGTETDPITFTGERERRGYWSAISFEETGGPNELQHVIVEYGGAPIQRRTDASVYVEGTSSHRSRVSIVDSTLRESEGYAISVDQWSVLEEFSGNTLTANELGAAHVYSTSADSLDSSTTYAGNDRDVVLVDGVAIGPDASVRWPALDVDYLVADRTLITGGHLTIEPGATLVFRHAASIDVRRDTSGVSGALTAVGTAEEPIRFTGEEESPGYWRGIGFSNAESEDNRFEHVTVEYAGSDSFYGGAAGGPPAIITVTAVEYSSTLSLSDVTLSHSGGHCIYVDESSSVTEVRVSKEACE